MDLVQSPYGNIVSLKQQWRLSGACLARGRLGWEVEFTMELESEGAGVWGKHGPLEKHSDLSKAPGSWRIWARMILHIQAFAFMLQRLPEAGPVGFSLASIS